MVMFIILLTDQTGQKYDIDTLLPPPPPFFFFFFFFLVS